jgi:hypothetical protein
MKPPMIGSGSRSRGLTKRDVLLAFIAAGEGPLDPVRIMKGMFLTAKEGELPPPLSYSFVPYSYGPCAFMIYDDIDALAAENLIEKRSVGARWPVYVATVTGKREADRIACAQPGLGNKVQGFRDYVSSRNFKTLLREVYAKYPDYASKSVFRDKA